MNDRELIDLAAKAAGIVDGHWLNDHSYWVGPYDGGYDWNPLTDDGDALRLAVKLWIDISFPPYMKHERPVVHAGKYWDNSDGCWYPHEELRGTDPYAATRRAIVKAAAEIGREMK